MSSVVVVCRTSCCSPGALAGAPVAPTLVEAILVVILLEIFEMVSEVDGVLIVHERSATDEIWSA